MENLTIYNLPSMPPRWDNVGLFYIIFCCTWTTLVFAGVAFCWFNRHSPALRLRGLPLSLSAIVFLHAYWVLAQITYPIGGTMPVVLAYDIQYFFMGIYFPLGIALFQASNMRFLHVAHLQRRYADPDFFAKTDGCNGASESWLCRLRNMNYTARIMIFIGLGMIFQVLLTIGMWLACLKYHPSFGIPGTGIRGETLQEQIVDLGRGWEWWPTVLWQVVWTWIVAPILLWRAWGIRDTMGWRTQTIGCCISNLHAAPMFLISTYVDAFEPVNAYFHPSQWIHLSTMMFEIFTVFVPVFQVIRLRMLTRRAALSSARWEADSQATLTLRTSTSTEQFKSSSVNLAERGRCSSPTSQFIECYLESAQGDRLLSMTALDHVLTENPGPLQDYSALNDFSGENIAFLTRMAAWKSMAWPFAAMSPTIIEEGSTTGPDLFDPRLEAFNQALEIYIDFISSHYAAFPLNISSHAQKQLQDIFAEPARAVRGAPEVNPATPFDMPSSRPSSDRTTMSAYYTGVVPDGFHQGVFDDVRDSVKYLVLTNTWPKFVSEMQQRQRQRQRRSADTERTLSSTASSQRTLVAKVVEKLHTLL